MSEPRLTSRLRVQACLRVADLHGAAAMVARRGEAEAGAILLKLNRLDGRATVLSETRDRDGGRVWMAATGPDPVADEQAEAYLVRATGRDPDLWIVEIEDRLGRHFMPEPIAAR
jgi:hypothetical protein